MPNVPKKSMQARVDDAINAGELNDEFLREYLNQLLAIWQELIKSMVRTVVLAVLAMILFGVLAGKGVSEVTILSFKLSNFSLLELAIPVFVACTALRIYALGIDNQIFSKVYDSIMLRKFPELYKSDLYGMIAPPGTGPIFDSSRIQFLKHSRSLPILKILDGFQDGIVVLVPVAFEVGAYIYLFNSPKVSDPFVWVSLSFTLSIFVATYAFAAAAEVI